MIQTIRQITVRLAQETDRHALANLLHFETHIHRHLDWRQPLDWLGSQPFLVASQDERVTGALICPPDPPQVAWLRLFACASGASLEATWHELWDAARNILHETDPQISAAAIPLQGWFRRLVTASGFENTHQVVVLAWNSSTRLQPFHQPDVLVRPMNYDDLPVVTEIDHQSFPPIWQNSFECLETAYRQAAIATVAAVEDRLVGYQISTATTLGGHLARLAVLPLAQGRGLGTALVMDLLAQFQARGARSVTVNTQKQNQASLSIYQRTGFRLTGEEYPVFERQPG
jgi:ribosomal-protein-alanine N-acetyltransferase